MGSSLQNVSDYSSKKGLPLHVSAIHLEYARWNDASLWPDYENTGGSGESFSNVPLISMDDDARKDILSMISRDLSRYIQFPASTIFLHGMGVLASAMMRNFSYRMYGSVKVCNLYMITSQPTGAGKSFINEYFSMPVKEEYDRRNQANHKERAVLVAKMKSLKKQLSASENEKEMYSIQDDIDKCVSKMNFFPITDYTWTDITPEALEKKAFHQNGFFNLISDEATTITSLMGGMYSDRVANNEMLLKGWDGEYIGSGRIGRAGASGYPHGTISVIAQDETIRAILDAGARGNGLCQRFLVWREETMMGRRDYSVKRTLNDDLRAEYIALVKSAFNERDTTLVFSDTSVEFISMAKARYEPTLSDTGENGQELLRGVVAKMDKQIMKIACVLHVMQEWGLKGQKKLTISDETVMWASSIFEALMQTYRQVAQSEGHAGIGAQSDFAAEKLRSMVEKLKGKPVSLNNLVSRVNNRGPFRGQNKVTYILREKVMPELESKGIAVLHESNIYINPKFR